MSNNFGNLTVQTRIRDGKGAARKLRALGRIPAIVYGQGKDNLKLTLNTGDLRKAMDPERKLNTYWKLDLVDESGKAAGKEACVIVDFQIDPLRDTYIHIDFMRVSEAEDVQVKVPVEYSGRAVGVAAGGKLRTLRRTVKVAVKPHQIPVKLEVDLTNIELGDSLRLKDLSLEGTRLLDHPDTVMALVESPRGTFEDEAKPAEGAADGEAAAEGEAEKKT